MTNSKFFKSQNSVEISAKKPM